MKKQTGTAIITALLITAIVAAIATVMAVRQSISIRETSLSINADRTYLDAQGVIAWAKVTLKNDLAKQIKNKDTDSLETFPKTLTLPDEFYGAKVSGVIEDALGKFNINSLTNTNNQRQFARLIEAVDPDIDENTALNIASNVSQWLRPSNADEIYMRKDPPYRASHMRMVNISELRLVQGVSARLYDALQPNITALPNNDSKTNLYDATQAVIMSLGDNITTDQAKAIVACQKTAKQADNPKQTLQDCMSKNNISVDSTIRIVYTSNYFITKAFVQLGNQHLRLVSLLQRKVTTKDKQIIITVNTLWQNRE